MISLQVYHLHPPLRLVHLALALALIIFLPTVEFHQVIPAKAIHQEKKRSITHLESDVCNVMLPSVLRVVLCPGITEKRALRIKREKNMNVSY